MNEAQAWQAWQEAIARRDEAAEAAHKAQWLRYQPKVEAARAAYMEARGDRS